MQDVIALGYAWTPAVATSLRVLFFTKWEAHETQQVRQVTAQFKDEWCNDRLGNWCSGYGKNSVINTNGLEATNKVIKDELTYYRQLMPVLDFLQRSKVWLSEQSAKRANGPNGEINPNKVTFAKTHTFLTKDSTLANAWRGSRYVTFPI
jgi:hypothetical protein